MTNNTTTTNYQSTGAHSHSFVILCSLLVGIPTLLCLLIFVSLTLNNNLNKEKDIRLLNKRKLRRSKNNDNSASDDEHESFCDGTEIKGKDEKIKKKENYSSSGSSSSSSNSNSSNNNNNNNNNKTWLTEWTQKVHKQKGSITVLINQVLSPRQSYVEKLLKRSDSESLMPGTDMAVIDLPMTLPQKKLTPLSPKERRRKNVWSPTKNDEILTNKPFHYYDYDCDEQPTPEIVVVPTSMMKNMCNHDVEKGKFLSQVPTSSSPFFPTTVTAAVTTTSNTTTAASPNTPLPLSPLHLSSNKSKLENAFANTSTSPKNENGIYSNRLSTLPLHRSVSPLSPFNKPRKLQHYPMTVRPFSPFHEENINIDIDIESRYNSTSLSLKNTTMEYYNQQNSSSRAKEDDMSISTISDISLSHCSTPKILRKNPQYGWMK